MADLLPVEGGNQGSQQLYCNLNADNELVVVVRNKGEGDAKQSTTNLAFLGSNVPLSTPPLAPEEMATLAPVPLPESDSGVITFTITADIGMKIDEADEENNVAVGNCSGL